MDGEEGRCQILKNDYERAGLKMMMANVSGERGVNNGRKRDVVINGRPSSCLRSDSIR